MQYFGGKVFIHTPKIHLPAPQYTQAFEWSYTKQTTGTHPWQQRFGFPETGLNLCYVHYGDARYGNAIGFYPSIQFRILSHRQIDWFWKIGGGIGYATKHWERTPAVDSFNNIIGSAMNNFTMMQTGLRYSFASKWRIQIGAAFDHLSNAAARQPNYGINTFSGFVGLHYYPNSIVQVFQKQEQVQSKNPFNIGAKMSMAFAEDKTVDGPIYPYESGSLFVSKMWRHKFRSMLGADITYSEKLYAFIKNNYLYPGEEKKHSYRYTVFAGHEFVFGRIGLPLQLGYYLNHPVGGGDKIYQKLGINYHFYTARKGVLKDMFLFTQLKTHFARAEYAELGLGFLF